MCDAEHMMLAGSAESADASNDFARMSRGAAGRNEAAIRMISATLE